MDWRGLLLRQVGGRDPIVEQWYRARFARSRLSRYTGQEHTDEELQAALDVACELLKSEYGIHPYSSRRVSREELASRRPSIVPESLPRGVTQTLESKQDGDVWTLSANGRICTLSQLLGAAEVDTDRWYVASWKANAYEAQRAGGGIVQLWQVKAELRERVEWLWKPVKPRARYTPPVIQDVVTTLVIPDSQNGYRWMKDMQQLEPLHDRLAWDIVCQVAEDTQPNRIVLLGDMVDYAEGSKRWPVARDLMQTTQPTIEELHWWLARLRESCPDSEIVYLEGNHEDRIDRALNQLQPELSGLRAAGDDRPLLTWSRLLSLEELGIRYVGPYAEDTRIALHPDCEASHGHKVRAGGGSTVAAVLKSSHVSQVFGHIHRRAIASRTIHGPKGQRTIFACSPGTLCRVDGIVPHAGGRLDWQQGFAFLTRVAGQTRCELAPIDDGVAVWRGEAIVGLDRSEEIARDTGWPQLA